MSRRKEREQRAPKLRVEDRVSVEALDDTAHLACIDGRHEGAIVGAPGGDAGEFLLLLSSVEAFGGGEIGPSSVEALLDAYLDEYARFYLHTDEHALEALRETLEADEATAEWFGEIETIEELEAWLREPPRPVRAALLEALVDPAHVGCGHLKTMLQKPEEAGVRRELTESVIRAFFTALWRGASEPEFVVLIGEHYESAIVRFGSGGAGDSEAAASVPAVEPEDPEESVFVLHMPARRHVWERDVRFLERAVDLPGFEVEDVDGLLHQIEELADRQLETTVRALAPDLPVWAATDEGETVSVQEPAKPA